MYNKFVCYFKILRVVNIHYRRAGVAHVFIFDWLRFRNHNYFERGKSFGIHLFHLEPTFSLKSLRLPQIVYSSQIHANKNVHTVLEEYLFIHTKTILRVFVHYFANFCINHNIPISFSNENSGFDDNPILNSNISLFNIDLFIPTCFDIY